MLDTYVITTEKLIIFNINPFTFHHRSSGILPFELEDPVLGHFQMSILVPFYLCISLTYGLYTNLVQFFYLLKPTP